MCRPTCVTGGALEIEFGLQLPWPQAPSRQRRSRLVSSAHGARLLRVATRSRRLFMAELALVVRFAPIRQHMDADRTTMCKSSRCEHRHDPHAYYGGDDCRA
jgi:hypothetical protein